MQVNVEERYNAVIFHLKGKLMGGPDAKNISEKVHSLIDQGKKHIVLDMSGVHYMNSTGIGILISTYTTLLNNGGDLKLASLDDKIEGVLSITKLMQVLPDYKTIDQAISSIN
jgi:anti-sigma B factor antagonist